MAQTPDGGSAFPKLYYSDGTGMSLRDYFAAKALHAVIDAYIVGNGPTVGTDHLPRNCAAHAYRIADAMLAEKDK